MLSPLHVVCGIIVDESGRALACLRPPGKHLADKWEFPGGKVEPGESPEAALIRELWEELDIVVEILRPLTPVIWDYGRGPIRLIPFVCRITNGEPKALDHVEVRWVTPSSVHELDWAEADGPILAEWLEVTSSKPG
ncbi:MAG: 8-oxo-dGTP diphosphatase MutT [Verrucomicrobiales bacterium VVV1]|nr:MAG: 8-oxo-dGTP diphosphatase MutT [Verrucomicrobiales bacterium VVV1]